MHDNHPRKTKFKSSVSFCLVVSTLFGHHPAFCLFCSPAKSRSLMLEASVVLFSPPPLFPAQYLHDVYTKQNLNQETSITFISFFAPKSLPQKLKKTSLELCCLLWLPFPPFESSLLCIVCEQMRECNTHTNASKAAMLNQYSSRPIQFHKFFHALHDETEWFEHG